MVRVALCGGVSIEVDGRPLPDQLLGGRQGRLVLAFLVCERQRSVTRDELAELLWGAQPPATWEASLSAVISRLRNMLGAAGIDGSTALASSFGSYRLHLPANAVVDIEELDRGVEAAEHALSVADGQAALEAAGAAASISQRGFLVDDSAWVDAQRARVLDWRVRALQAMAQAHLMIGQTSRGVLMARDALSLDELRESSYRLLMEALAAAGERGEALRVWERCRVFLEAELGADPSPETEKVYLAILDAGRPTAEPAAPALPTGVVTFVLTDVEGSSRLWEDHPAAMDSALTTHDQLLEAAVGSAHGRILKSRGEGDSSVSVFTRASDAIASAAAIQQALEATPWPEGCALRVRIAVHTGEASERDGDYFGPTLNRAARMRELATGGQIFCSRITADLVGDHLPEGCALTEVGVRELRGLRRAEQVYELRLDGEARPDTGVHSRRPPLGAGAMTAASAPFVGRVAEGATTRRAWNRAGGGGLVVAMLAGEPGIGKTTLAARTAADAWNEGATVLVGHCQEGVAVPFQPILEAFGAWVEAQSPSWLRSALTADAVDAALLLPQLRQLLPGYAAPSGAEHERYRMFSAVPALLRMIAVEGSVVLVLEDLHWADLPTIQLLRHLVTGAAQSPVLILGTYRDTDLGPRHPLREALVEWHRAGVSEVIALGGLSRDEVATLVAPDVSPDPADRELAATLWDGTEGNPLFLRELLRHLEETGGVERRPERRWLARKRVDTLGIPSGVKDTIAQRVARLDETTVTVLRVGSVLGRELQVGVVEAVTRLAPEAILDALDAAERAGLVAEVPGALGRYAFTHALVVRAVYEELSQTRRARMHLQVAEAMEGAGVTDADLTALARHYTEAAGLAGPARAIEYCRRAGEYAREAGAREDAAAHFQAALDLLGGDTASEALRTDLLIALGQVQWRTSIERARQTFLQAADLARAMADGERLAQAALGFSGFAVEATLADQGSGDPTVHALLQEALTVLGPGDSAARARVGACLSVELYYTPDATQRRRSLWDQSLAVARRLGDPATLGFVLICRSVPDVGTVADTEAALANTEEGLDFARRSGDRELECLALWVRGCCRLLLDDIKGARETWDECVALAAVLKNPFYESVAQLTLTSLATLEGRFADALRSIDAAFALARPGDTVVLAAIVAEVANVRWAQGRMAEIAGSFPPLVEVIPRFAGYCYASAALAAAQQGDADAARSWLSRVHPADAATFPRGIYWSLFASIAALAAAETGSRELIAELAVDLRPYARCNTCAGGLSVGPVSTVLGILESALGNFDQAEADFDHGLGVVTRHGWFPFIAVAQVQYAKMLATRAGPGDRERARRLVDEAVGIATDIGAGEVLRVAGPVEDVLDGRQPRPPAGPPRRSRSRRARGSVVAGGRSALHRLTSNTSDEGLAHRMGRPLAQRAAFLAMARTFDAHSALGFEGDIVYELVPLADAPSVWWTVQVRGDKATAHRGYTRDAAITIRVRADDFVRIASGQLHPMTPFSTGRLSITGDVLVALRLQDMFGGG